MPNTTSLIGMFSVLLGGAASAQTLSVTACTPPLGPANGGTVVVVDGSGFQAVQSLTIGGQPVRDLTVISSTRITGITAGGTPGVGDVSVTTSTGSASLPNGFRYGACRTSASGALRFDHTLGQELTSSANFDMPQGVITVEAWIYPRGGENACCAFNGMLVQWGTYSPVRWEVFQIFDNASFDNFQVCFQKDWASPSGGCSGWHPTRRWYHVAVTYDGATIRFYFDGAASGVAAASGPIRAASPGAIFSVGGQTQQNDDHFSGTLDELRIWSVVRTPDQIAENMYQELSGTEAGLFAYYTFDQGSGQAVTDLTGRGRALTVGRGSGSESRDPVWVVAPPTCTRPARSVAFGNSCGSVGFARIFTSAIPEAGAACGIRLADAPANAVGALLTSAVPTTATIFGTCAIYVDSLTGVVLAPVVVSTSGTWSSVLNVPTEPSLAGLALVAQVGMLSPPTGALETSNALYWVVSY